MRRGQQCKRPLPRSAERVRDKTATIQFLARDCRKNLTSDLENSVTTSSASEAEGQGRSDDEALLRAGRAYWEGLEKRRNWREFRTKRRNQERGEFNMSQNKGM